MNEVPTRDEIAEHVGHVSRDCVATQTAPILAYIAGYLLTREEAANEMVKFFNTYCEDAPYWPEIEDALKWLEAGDESA